MTTEPFVPRLSPSVAQQITEVMEHYYGNGSLEALEEKIGNLAGAVGCIGAYLVANNPTEAQRKALLISLLGPYHKGIDECLALSGMNPFSLED